MSSNTQVEYNFFFHSITIQKHKQNSKYPMVDYISYQSKAWYEADTFTHETYKDILSTLQRKFKDNVQWWYKSKIMFKTMVPNRITPSVPP